MKNTNKTVYLLYLILAIAGLLIIWTLADMLSAHDIGFSNLLALLPGLAVTVWALISIYLIKKKNRTNCEDADTVFATEDVVAEMKNVYSTPHFVLIIAGLMAIHHAVGILLARREASWHFLWLFVWVVVVVWILILLHLAKKRKNNDILHFLQKMDALNVKKYIWPIRILLIFLWIRVVGQLFILLNMISTNFILGNMLPEDMFDNHALSEVQENMFEIHEFAGAGLQLLTGLTVAILVSIYFRKKRKAI